MKIILVFSLVTLIACSTTKEMPTTLHNPVVAHRGAFKKNHFPENSIAALKEAIRLKCAGTEFDVRMSADDTLLINHDPHYHGLDIEKNSYGDLTAYTLSNGEKLPTLREYLVEGLKDNRKTRLVIEIKPTIISKERGLGVAENVVALVKELKAEPMVMYISFDIGILKKIISLDPDAHTQYLNGDRSPAELKADKIAGLDYHFSVFRLKPEWIREAKELGLVLNAWTVNDVETMKWLVRNGFDYITTNEPEMLFDLIGNSAEN